MVKFLLFCILAVLCWPLALIALVVYPIIWVLMLPFRVVGIVLTGVFAFVGAIFMLPAKIIKSIV
ncbi:hypothetical protein [Paludibaculum fermentans]|uniref:Uncharacterized protein n=1 Tax=Paludibaculum fermentans TaxID=1473598 RepID=A0A7S7NJV8_PALFE|nr:hypothetical protein [Paludibaculum fermentans]QOY84942.1 hypothetical protein IRI77_18975 [Paludibaculum fermentans]